MRHFTLIEVVVSLAILGLSLVSLLALANTSQRRMMLARDRWQNTHMISQAAEYYLLHSDESPPYIGTDFFDYPGFTVNIRYNDAEGLPDELNQIENQQPLRSLFIEIFNSSEAKVVDSITIDRIKYSE